MCLPCLWVFLCDWSEVQPQAVRDTRAQELSYLLRMLESIIDGGSETQHGSATCAEDTKLSVNLSLRP